MYILREKLIEEKILRQDSWWLNVLESCQFEDCVKDFFKHDFIIENLNFKYNGNIEINADYLGKRVSIIYNKYGNIISSASTIHLHNIYIFALELKNNMPLSNLIERTEIESAPGAAVRIRKIILTEQGQRCLTTSATSFGPPYKKQNWFVNKYNSIKQKFHLGEKNI
jgi:hypothetical protein